MANEYVTSSEFKATYQITGTASDADINLALEAASRTIDLYKQTRYYPTSETRYYSPSIWDRTVWVDDLNALGTVSVDVAGDGSYSSVWTQGTHFVLEPVNAALHGEPFNQVTILPQSGQQFSGYINGLKIEASFGWATVTPQIKQATSVLAGRLYNRRNSPLGVLSLGVEGTAVHLSRRLDPDIQLMLDNTGGREPRLIA